MEVEIFFMRVASSVYMFGKVKYCYLEQDAREIPICTSSL